MFRQFIRQLFGRPAARAPAPQVPAGVPEGSSLAPKWVVFNILDDNAQDVEVLDIGFGTGGLASLIKDRPETAHWQIDGIDGWEVNCNNPELIAKKLYRSIRHGLAQEMSAEELGRYRIICLLDVIEHLERDMARKLSRMLLTNLGEKSFLFVSTPLWFFPQDSHQRGDLEAHLIGVPASSMMALCPVMYAVNAPLIGGFVLDKSSLELIEFFQPTADRNFTVDKGFRIVQAMNMNYQPGVLTRRSV